MNDKDLKRLMSRAFPERGETLPADAIWSRIEAGAGGTVSARRSGPRWWMAAAAVVVTALPALLLVLFRGEPDAATPLDAVLGEMERAQGPTRNWVIAHRPHHWQRNEPAIRALDRAIAETRALLSENPADEVLSSRVVMYVNWRADLIAGLAHENG